MKSPKTIKGYISLIKKIEKIPPSFLEGFDDLDDYTQDLIAELYAAISNRINEIPDDYNKKPKKKK